MSRQKGTPNLTEDRKAEILAAKQAHLTTVKQLADDFGIARKTVHQVERDASPEVRAKAEELAASLTDRIEQARDKALLRINERLDSGVAPLNHLTTAFGVLYDKHALETGRPTSLVKHVVSAEEHAWDFWRMLAGKLAFADALQTFRAAQLAPLVSDSTRDRVVALIEAGKGVDGVEDAVDGELLEGNAS